MQHRPIHSYATWTPSNPSPRNPSQVVQIAGGIRWATTGYVVEVRGGDGLVWSVLPESLGDVPDNVHVIKRAIVIPIRQKEQA